MRCPMRSVSFLFDRGILGLHLGMLFQQTVTPQLPQCTVIFFCGIIQPIPSFHLIYRSLLRTVVAVKSDN